MQGGAAGACGNFNPDSAHIAALQTAMYGNLGAVSSHCGQQIKITNTQNGKTVIATVADACPTCVSSTSVDLSYGAFTEIATVEEGMVPITWEFL
jgi:expansin (peptidoglycan-binding protein)